MKYLEPEDRVDLETLPSESWPNLIRARLSASTVRLTNIIEISYRSKSPRAAVAVVNAVLRSYLEFMDKTHKGTAGELINVFTKEKVQLEERLAQKQEEVLRRGSGSAIWEFGPKATSCIRWCSASSN